MPGEARYDLALKNLGQCFFLCGVIYRRRLVCGFLRHSNGDEGAMSKRWLWETSQVLAWKYFESERSEKQNLHGSGRTRQTEKKIDIVKKEKASHLHHLLWKQRNLWRNSTFCVSPTFIESALAALSYCYAILERWEIFLGGTKEKGNELETQGFFSKNVGLGLLYIFE